MKAGKPNNLFSTKLSAILSKFKYPHLHSEKVPLSTLATNKPEPYSTSSLYEMSSPPSSAKWTTATTYQIDSAKSIAKPT